MPAARDDPAPPMGEKSREKSVRRSRRRSALLAGLALVGEVELLLVDLLVADPDLGAVVALLPGARVGLERQVLIALVHGLLLVVDLRLARAVPGYLDLRAGRSIRHFHRDVDGIARSEVVPLVRRRDHAIGTDLVADGHVVDHGLGF